MTNKAKSETGRRIIEALEQVTKDATISAAKRRKAERDLAEWRAARDA